MVGKLWYLKKIDLLETLDEDALKTLSECTDMEQYDPGETIYLPGSASETVYFLKEGRVTISRINEEGRKITLALLEPGEMFGELAGGDESRHESVAEAQDRSLVCYMGADRFRSFLEDHPELALEVSTLLDERRRHVESRIERLMLRDAPSRLALVLKDLFEHHGTESDDREAVPEIMFSHREIADLCGLTRPTTTHQLNELQEDGVIELGHQVIRLADPAGLERRATSEA